MAITIFRNRKKDELARMRFETILARYHKEYPVSRNPTVLSIIHSIASTVSTLGLDLYQKTKSGSYKAYSHPAAMLLENPNGEDSPTQFLYRMTTQFLSSGNVYLYNQGVALRVLDSAHMKVVRNTVAPFNKTYIYDGQSYSESDIVHVYNPQYYDGTTGHSPIEYNAEIIELLNDLLLYVGTYFKNSAGERLYVSPEKDSIKDLKDPAMKKEFERFMRENIFDPLSKGKPILTLPGMKIENVKQTTNVESELKSLIDRIEKEVAKLFSFPLYKLTGDYGNNLSAQQVNYLQTCILPITEIFKEKFRVFIPAKDRPFMYWDFDYSNLLMADIETKHKILREDIRGSLISVNEARREIGRDVYTGGTDLAIGDMLWVLRNNAPILEEYRDLYVQPTAASSSEQEKQSDSGDTNNTRTNDEK